MFRARSRGLHWKLRRAFLPLSVSHKRQSSPRPEYAEPALGRCERPLRIAVHISGDPESGERPTLFIASCLDTHIEEDIERFLARQAAVFVKMVDHLGVGAFNILRINLQMLDQGLLRALLVLLRQAN